MIFKYYLWVVLVILVYVGSAYTTNKLNITKNNIWLYLNWLFSSLPIWPLVAKHSTSLVFDGMLFDIILIISYTIAILILTRSFDSMRLINYMGIIFIIVGLIMFKYNN